MRKSWVITIMVVLAGVFTAGMVYFAMEGSSIWPSRPAMISMGQRPSSSGQNGSLGQGTRSGSDMSGNSQNYGSSGRSSQSSPQTQASSQSSSLLQNLGTGIKTSLVWIVPTLFLALLVGDLAMLAWFFPGSKAARAHGSTSPLASSDQTSGGGQESQDNGADEPENQAQEAAQHCPHCGEEVKAEWITCPSCTKPLPNNPNYS